MLNALSARIMTWATTARQEDGQGLVEYALILVFVSVVSIAMLTILGVDVGEVFTDIETKLNGAG
jgi:pilus assembly protein Flp/PilA